MVKYRSLIIVVGMVLGNEPYVTNILSGVQILWWTIAPSAETISWTYVSNEASYLHVNVYGDQECFQKPLCSKTTVMSQFLLYVMLCQQELNGTRDLWAGDFCFDLDEFTLEQSRMTEFFHMCRY